MESVIALPGSTAGGEYRFGIGHPDPDAIAAAKQAARKAGRRNLHFAVGAAQRLPYPDGAFDVVILSWTL